MSREFGHHAMVEGAVPMTFDKETSALIQPLVDSKYIQEIPEAYGGNPAKFWVDASLLNYSMLVQHQRDAKWMPVAILGTDHCVISNIGDGVATEVDVATGNEVLGASTTTALECVEPGHGILLQFAKSVKEGSELRIGWTSENGERLNASLTMPEVTHRSTTKNGLRSVA